MNKRGGGTLRGLERGQRTCKVEGPERRWNLREGDTHAIHQSFSLTQYIYIITERGWDREGCPQRGHRRKAASSEAGQSLRESPAGWFKGKGDRSASWSRTEAFRLLALSAIPLLPSQVWQELKNSSSVWPLSRQQLTLHLSRPSNPYPETYTKPWALSSALQTVQPECPGCTNVRAITCSVSSALVT